MRRSAAVAALGAVLLVAAALTPVATLLVAEYDTEYTHEVQAEGYCAEVAGSATPGGTGEFRHELSELPDETRAHVTAAVANGSHSVDETPADAPFRFTDDNLAPGEGCYVVADGGETYPLRTTAVARRTDAAGPLLSTVVGPALLVGGVAALLAAGALAVRNRRRT